MAHYYIAEDTSGDGRLGARRSSTNAASSMAYLQDFYGNWLLYQRNRFMGASTDALARKRAGLTSRLAVAPTDCLLASTWWIEINGVDTAFLKGDGTTWADHNYSGAGSYEPHGSPDDDKYYLSQGPLGSSGSDYYWSVRNSFDFGPFTSEGVVAMYKYDGRTPAPFTARLGVRIDGQIHGQEGVGFVDPDGSWYTQAHHVDWAAYLTDPTNPAPLYIVPGRTADINAPALLVANLALLFIASGIPVFTSPSDVVFGPAGYTPWDLDASPFNEGDAVGADTALYVRWPVQTITSALDPFPLNVATLKLTPTPNPRPLAGFRVGPLGFAPTT